MKIKRRIQILSNMTRLVKVGLSGRNSYPVQIKVNGIRIVRVVIDPHYKLKHGTSINDALILRLANQLNGKRYKPEKVTDQYRYFVADPLQLDQMNYRFVWLLEDHKNYLGVINAFRR